MTVQYHQRNCTAVCDCRTEELKLPWYWYVGIFSVCLGQFAFMVWVSNTLPLWALLVIGFPAMFVGHHILWKERT